MSIVNTIINSLGFDADSNTGWEDRKEEKWSPAPKNEEAEHKIDQPETIAPIIETAEAEVSCPHCGRLREHADIIVDGHCDQCHLDTEGNVDAKSTLDVNADFDYGAFNAWCTEHGLNSQNMPEGAHDLANEMAWANPEYKALYDQREQLSKNPDQVGILHSSEEYDALNKRVVDMWMPYFEQAVVQLTGTQNRVEGSKNIRASWDERTFATWCEENGIDYVNKPEGAWALAKKHAMADPEYKAVYDRLEKTGHTTSIINTQWYQDMNSKLNDMFLPYYQEALLGLTSTPKRGWLLKSADNMGDNTRWTYEPSAMPGEPSYYLDGDMDSAVAAIVEEENVKSSHWLIMNGMGQVKGTFPTSEEAREAAETMFPLGTTASRKVKAEVSEEQLLKEFATALSATEIEMGKTDEDGGTFIADGVDYRFIWSEDIAERIALAQVTEDLESEPELFTQDWLQSFLSITPTDKRIMASEEADNLVDEVYSADDLVEKAELDEEYAKAQESGNEDRVEKVVEKARELVRDSEAERIEEELNDPIQYFVNEHGMYTIEQLMKANFITIDIEEAAKSAVNTDGWAHFISRYSGDYDTTPSGVVFFQE